jgi:D-2-hydroxyglutarate dehydrogenase
VVTAVAVSAPRRPAATNLVLLACDSFDKVCGAFLRARESLGEILSAVEFLDAECVDLAVRQMSGTLRHPMPIEGKGGGEGGRPAFYLLIETSGSVDSHDKEKMDAFLEAVMSAPAAVAAAEAGEAGEAAEGEAEGEGSSPLARDGVVAQDEAQLRAIWAVREMQAVAQADFARQGSAFFYDISAPTTKLYELVERTKARFKEADLPFPVHVLGFGHLGDGNLHLNVLSEAAGSDGAILEVLEPFIFELTAEFDGSISAEHGLGRMKANEIGYSKDSASVAVMRALKATFDPKGILNPYKVLPNNEEKEEEKEEEEEAEREFTREHADKWASWAAEARGGN